MPKNIPPPEGISPVLWGFCLFTGMCFSMDLTPHELERRLRARGYGDDEIQQLMLEMYLDLIDDHFKSKFPIRR